LQVSPIGLGYGEHQSVEGLISSTTTFESCRAGELIISKDAASRRWAFLLAHQLGLN
jgi:hypothetical protein